jgi:hypothetical protein
LQGNGFQQEAFHAGGKEVIAGLNGVLTIPQQIDTFIKAA